MVTDDIISVLCKDTIFASSNYIFRLYLQSMQNLHVFIVIFIYLFMNFFSILTDVLSVAYSK